MNGIINIYKQRGYTSHDVVAKVRRILQMKKVGHTGTLDPEAEGVLPICIGRGTKVADYLTNKNKGYRATVCLGITTTTEDATGDIIEVKEVNVTKEQIEKAVHSFVGSYMQVPPMYSALKVKGQKLYELARQGIVIERKAREVVIEQCNIVEYNGGNEFVIDVKCSKGTYIRTLCTDIGQLLGCGAHMKSLIRTYVGDFNIENSITLSQLEELKENGQLESCFIPIDHLFLDLPALHVKTSANKYLYNGNQLPHNAIIEQINVDLHSKARIYDSEDRFMGIYVAKQIQDRMYYSPEKIFSTYKI